MPTRRMFLASAAAAQALRAEGPDAIRIDPRPLFDISPWLYMQFMEPLGTTDSSVEAAWDYDRDDWREDFVRAVADLAPGAVRWGGLFSRYYKWREGVGPAARRPWMRNYVWGGKETNRVGTHEFVDFCRRVGADPLYCVNFLGDGVARYRQTPEGDRTGDAREAADWVSYANDPDNRERRANGSAEPLRIPLWQLGNETSYGRAGFRKSEAIARTIEFARAMKQRDRSIRLIGWGDRGQEGLWAPDLIREAGEHIDLVAWHMMGQSPQRPDTVLRGLRYQQDPARAWEELLELSNNVETRVAEMEQAIGRAPQGIAITEGHLSLRPSNANPILAEWLSAVYHARSLNIYQRHGAKVRIATAADFEGTRWTVNAVILPVPGGNSFLMPSGTIMRLFKRHSGTHGAAVKAAPANLDIASSRAGSRLFLHVLNMSFNRAVEAGFAAEGAAITGGKVYQVAPDNPREYVNQEQPDVFRPREFDLPATQRWRFPARSVSAVELELSA